VGEHCGDGGVSGGLRVCGGFEFFDDQSEARVDLRVLVGFKLAELREDARAEGEEFLGGGFAVIERVCAELGNEGSRAGAVVGAGARVREQKRITIGSRGGFMGGK